MEPAAERQLFAFDIETTGLDPAESHVVAIGLVGPDSETGKLGESESEILRWIEEEILALPDSSMLLTWNGEEFDLPFLAHRFEANGIQTSLQVVPRQGIGKYGKPLFRATWGGLMHIDLAPIYASVAREAGVSWGLKPVARAILGVEPVEVDRRGSAIAALDSDLLRAYVTSDARITYQLGQRLSISDLAASIPEVG